jgi:prefoldin subunit 5
MAEYLIAKHGAAATRVARDRIDELKRNADHRASAVWQEIAATIEQLQQEHAGDKPARDDDS